LAGPVGGWLAESGLDGWVIQREVQDPAEYAETWIRDGGQRPGDGRYEAMYAAWLADFAARGVEAIGFGVITLRRPQSGAARIRHCEEIRTPLGHRAGDAVFGCFAARSWLADTGEDRLLDTRLVVSADVIEERYGQPGAEHPAVIQLRQGGGLNRVVTADTALAGFVGACDGQLTAGQIVSALGILLEEPVDQLRTRLVPACTRADRGRAPTDWRSGRRTGGPAPPVRCPPPPPSAAVPGGWRRSGSTG